MTRGAGAIVAMGVVPFLEKNQDRVLIVCALCGA
jgi:hypothetical protein